MLTVDYERLGLHAGDRLLDIGCGFGRHSYEALRRGADVVSSDYSLPELVEVENTVKAMDECGELPIGVASSSCNGDVTRLPFPDGAFDRIIASEILEHISDDLTALNELGDNHKEILMLRYYSDLSYAEIADALQIKLGTVMSRLSRAKVQLSHVLTDAGMAYP